MIRMDTPQSLSAERQRQAAARARAYRQRARLAGTVDEIMVDALAEGMQRLRRGTSVDVFIRDVMTDAIGRLRAAGIEKPKTVLGQRMGLIERSQNESLS